jgi:transposase
VSLVVPVVELTAEPQEVEPTVPAEPEEYAARIGLDWADQKHFWSMRTAEGKHTRGELENTPEAVQVWAAELAQRFAGRRIAVALEQSRGSVIAMLCKYAHLHLFPIAPASLSYYRKSVYPSGAKSDPVDGDLILEYLLKHPERLRCWEPDTVETRSLQFLVEERRKLVNQKVRETQILTHWLKQVFPQMLRWFEDVTTPLVGDLLLRWPLLPDLQRASEKSLRRFFHQHNGRGEKRLQERLEQIRQGVPATTDAALLRVGRLRIQQAVRVLAAWRTAIAEFDQEIKTTYASHPDRFLAESVPGAGPALEPRLIAAVGSKRQRFASANEMACCFGVAPVTAGSGQSRWVHWRWACSKFVRQSFHEWAACSIRTCEWARQYYDQQRDKGKGHHAAVRALAYKWIRIYFRCWRDGVAYSEERYLKAKSTHTLPQPPPAGPPAGAEAALGSAERSPRKTRRAAAAGGRR